MRIIQQTDKNRYQIISIIMVYLIRKKLLKSFHLCMKVEKFQMEKVNKGNRRVNVSMTYPTSQKWQLE